MSTYSPSLEEIAYHEAGHTVAACLFYDTFEKVTIVEDDSDGTSTYGRTYASSPESLLSQPNTEEGFVEYLKAMIFCLCGRYFQLAYSGVDDPDGSALDQSDFKRYLNFNTAFAFNNIASKAIEQFCSNETIMSMVKKVAEALLEHKELDAAAVHELLKDFSIDYEDLLEDIKIKFYHIFCNNVNLFTNVLDTVEPLPPKQKKEVSKKDSAGQEQSQQVERDSKIKEEEITSSKIDTIPKSES